MKRILYLLGVTFLFLPEFVFGQCAPPSPSCAGCTNLTGNNQNLSTGTYCVASALSNINIQAGATVCLSATGSLTNSNLNGGTLIFNGGTLTNFNANSGDLRIHGILSNPVNTSFNGARVIVENGGVLNMGNMDVNGAVVVDGGTINTTGLFRINGNGIVCLANMGQIITNTFENNRNNSTTAQVTRGCIRIAQPGNINQPLTTTPNVLVCLPGTTVPPNLGSATVNTTCSGCAVALPVTYAFFRAQPLPQGVRLEWQTSAESHHSHFIVERSADAMDFAPISGKVIDPFGSEKGTYQYRYTDQAVTQGTFYYRLRQVDTDGTVAHSKLLAVSLGDQNLAIRLFPNPITNELTVNLETAETGNVGIEVLDVNGRPLLRQSGQKLGSSHVQKLNVDPLPPGIYLVAIRLGDRYFIRNIVK
ncbi:hypothetical protein GCM10027299_50260 [Larkinella ripae]